MRSAVERPILKFVPTEESLERQTGNLKKWWLENKERVFDAIDYYIYCNWQVGSIKVLVGRASKRGSRASTYKCEGEIFVGKPDELYISIGKRVRWTKGNLSVFIHELIHCATHSHEDRRFKKPGSLEFWILDELATDLLTQYVLKRVTGFKPKIRDSLDYALVDVTARFLNDKELRDKLIRRIKKKQRSYLKTEKKFYSFRKDLLNI